MGNEQEYENNAHYQQLLNVKRSLSIEQEITETDIAFLQFLQWQESEHNLASSPFLGEPERKHVEIFNQITSGTEPDSEKKIFDELELLKLQYLGHLYWFERINNPEMVNLHDAPIKGTLEDEVNHFLERNGINPRLKIEMNPDFKEDQAKVIDLDPLQDLIRLAVFTEYSSLRTDPNSYSINNRDPIQSVLIGRYLRDYNLMKEYLNIPKGEVFNYLELLSSVFTLPLLFHLEKYYKHTFSILDSNLIIPEHIKRVAYEAGVIPSDLTYPEQTDISLRLKDVASLITDPYLYSEKYYELIIRFFMTESVLDGKVFKVDSTEQVDLSAYEFLISLPPYLLRQFLNDFLENRITKPKASFQINRDNGTDSEQIDITQVGQRSLISIGKAITTNVTSPKSDQILSNISEGFRSAVMQGLDLDELRRTKIPLTRKLLPNIDASGVRCLFNLNRLTEGDVPMLVDIFSDFLNSNGIDLLGVTQVYLSGEKMWNSIHLATILRNNNRDSVIIHNPDSGLYTELRLRKRVPIEAQFVTEKSYSRCMKDRLRRRHGMIWEYVFYDKDGLLVSEIPISEDNRGNDIGRILFAVLNDPTLLNLEEISSNLTETNEVGDFVMGILNLYYNYVFKDLINYFEQAEDFDIKKPPKGVQFPSIPSAIVKNVPVLYSMQYDIDGLNMASQKELKYMLRRLFESEDMGGYSIRGIQLALMYLYSDNIGEIIGDMCMDYLPEEYNEIVPIIDSFRDKGPKAYSTVEDTEFPAKLVGDENYLNAYLTLNTLLIQLSVIKNMDGKNIMRFQRELPKQVQASVESGLILIDLKKKLSMLFDLIRDTNLDGSILPGLLWDSYNDGVRSELGKIVLKNPTGLFNSPKNIPRSLRDYVLLSLSVYDRYREILADETKNINVAKNEAWELYLREYYS